MSIGSRRCPLPPEADAEIRSYVATSWPTTDEAIAWIQERWGVSYSLTGARNLLLRLGAVMPHGRRRGSVCRWDLPEARAARERHWAKQQENAPRVSYAGR